MNRRQFAGGALALAITTLSETPALAASASREFRILRDGKDIGRHVLTANAADGVFEIRIDIDIAVKVLGLTAYRYTLENNEQWRGGRLVSVSSRANEDGDRHRLSVTGGSGALRIDGSAYSGTAPVDAVTTSYFAREMIDRRPWISSQSGEVLDVAAASQGSGRFRISGGVETTLTYDAGGEWVGCSFDGQGEQVTYEIISGSGAIAGLWTRT